MKPKLYGYWRSSASWRARWGLHIKKIPYEYIPVNILKEEHKSAEHLKRNPIGALPSLEIVPGHFLTQSMAILMWADENFAGEHYLFGKDRTNRYKIIELCEIINADTAPLQNIGTLKHYSDEQTKKVDWAKHFIKRGLAAFEKQAAQCAGQYSVGNQLSAADIFLIPQMYNAKRFELSFDEYPTLKKIWDNCIATEACQKSSPEKQPDAV